MSRGGVGGPEEHMQKRVGRMGSRGEQQVVVGGQEAEVGMGGKGEGQSDGGHTVVVEDRLLSRVPGRGLCTVKRVGWMVGECIQPGQRWKESVIAAMTGRTRLSNQTSHCKHSKVEMVTGEAAVGRW